MRTENGASASQKFFRITVPLLRPVILLVVVLGTIGTLQIFDQVKILTAGEPLGATLTPVFLIYREALGDHVIGLATCRLDNLFSYALSG